MVLNSILNLVLEKLAADPDTPTAGRIYYNTASNTIRFANGTAWDSVGGTLTGTQVINLLLGVDGEGSGLDADLLDGLESAAFALSGHNHTAANITDFVAAVDARIVAAITGGAADVTVDTIAEFTALIKENELNLAAVLSAKRFQENVGDGTATSFTISHNLNTLDAIVQVVEVATGEQVIADNARNGANSVVVTFSVAPTTGQYRVIILA